MSENYGALAFFFVTLFRDARMVWDVATDVSKRNAADKPFLYFWKYCSTSF